MKTTITDLREHLFETIESLKDDKKPMDIERAKAISNVAGMIIQSAKVEVDMVRVTGKLSGSGFFKEGDGGKTPALASGASAHSAKALAHRT